MGTRIVFLPDGKWTEAPENLTDDQVYQALGVQPATPAAKPGGNGWMGDIARGVGGVLSGAGQLLHDSNNPAIQAARAIPGVDVAMGALDAARPYIPSGTAAAIKQRGDEMQANNPGTINSWRDIHGAGDLARFAKETVLSSAPMLAGGILTGSPTSMFAMSALPTYAQIRDQQAKTGINDVPGALLASAASGALDVELGVGGAIQRAVGRRAVEGVADGFLKSTAKTTLSEGFTEGLQQVAQRAGGHQDLTSPEAYDEYITNALGGALAGGVTGAALHPLTKTRNNAQLDDDGVDIPPPIDPSGPTNMLALPAPHDMGGPTMFVNPHGEVGQSLGEVDAFNDARANAPVPDMRTPAMAAAPIGSQANLFSPLPTAPTEETPARTDEGGQKETPLPDPLQPSLFDKTPTALTRTGFGPQEIRMALTGGAKPDPFVHKLGVVLSRAFAEGDIDTARKTVERELDKLTTAKVTPETIDHRLQVLNRANHIVETYNHSFLRDHAEEGVIKAAPGAVVGETIPKDSSIAVALADNAKSKAEEPAVRKQLLEKTVSTPDIRDPLAYFQAQLKRNGLHPEVSDDEFDHLYRAVEAEQATQNELDARAANNGVAPIEAQITPARKGDVAAALNEPDMVRAKLNEAAATPENTQQTPKQPEKKPESGVTKVEPGNARGLEQRTTAAVGEADSEPEHTGELTQAQIDQRETYNRVNDARVKNHIDDHEQALLTNMIRHGASDHVVRQAVADLTRQRKGRAEQIRKQALTGKRTPRDANIALAENQPRDARFPQRVAPADISTPEQIKAQVNYQNQLTSAARAGDTNGALRVIAAHDGNTIQRMVAQALVRMGVDVPLDIVPNDEVADEFNGFMNIWSDGTAEIVIPERAIGPSVILHESIHAALITRIGTFERDVSDADIKRLPKQMRDAILDMYDLREKLSQTLKNAPPSIQMQPWAAETLRSMDEFLAYIPTDTDAQEFFSSIDSEGNPVANKTKSLWAKLIDTLRRLLGLPPTKSNLTALDDIMRIQSRIFKSGETMPPDRRTIRNQLKQHLASQAAHSAPQMASPQPAPTDEHTYVPFNEVAKHDFKTGEPVVVQGLHGTGEAFNTFDMAKGGSMTKAASAKKAIWFTSRRKTAEYYANAATHELNIYRSDKLHKMGAPGWKALAEPRVMSREVQFDNPMVVDMKNSIYREETFSDMIDRAKAAGHDGLILKRAFDSGETSKIGMLFDGIMIHGHGLRFRGETLFAAFDPEKIGDKPVPGLTLYQRGATSDNSAQTEQAPPKFIEPRHVVADALQGKVTRGAALLALGNKLTEMAQKAGVKSAQAYQRLLDERRAISSKVESAYVDLSEDFDRLNAPLRGRGKGTLNALAKRSIFSGRWAFQPDWLRDDKGNAITVTVDPELNAEYMALPADARKVFNDMLRVPHETLHRKRKAVTELIEGEHSVLLKDANDKLNAAMAAGTTGEALDDVAREARIARKRRDMDLQQFGRLFNVNLSEPYMPIRRFGDYVVVARSPEYLAEEQKARATGDDEKLEKMKAEPQHYFVDFAETNEAAGRMRRTLTPQFGKENVEKFTKDQARETMLGGRDMFHAFGRLRKLIDDSVPAAQKGRLDKMVTDLLLSTLIQTSSRKSEMARLKVNGGNFDMMRGAISQGRADAQFIGALHKNTEITDTLSKMKNEAAFQNGERDAAGREERQSLVNEIMARHAMSMSPPPPNALADKATAMTSTFMLTTSPSFYVQQITQPLVMSVPFSAARHGYGRAIAALHDGYQRVAEAWSGTGLTGSLDLDKLPVDMRPFAYWLAERGRLDVGINKEMGSWSSDGRGGVTDAIHGVVHKLSGLTRKFEAINRLSTGVMEYTLQRQQERVSKIHDEDAYASYVKDTKEAHPGMLPMSEKEFAAANHALKLIDDTHGNYDMANAPRFMRTPVGRVLTQFKKFQIMQVQLYAQTMKDGFFDKSIDPDERAVARKALAYMTGHAAIMAGGLGLPAVSSLVWLFEALMSGKDEPPDAERDIRKAIGNETLAELLLHGAPTLAGLNLTGSIGQGNILALAPYADSPIAKEPKDAKAQAALYMAQLAGPMIGGIIPQMAEGLSFMANGDLYKGLEGMMPRGLNAAMRSYREATQGETNRAGEVTEPDISARETIYSALGLQPIERTRRQFRREQAFNDADFYDGKATDLRKEYAAAAPADRPALRTQWMELQKLRDAHGFKRQPMSSLLSVEKSNRRKMVDHGVIYTKSQRDRIEQLDDLTDEDDNQEE